MQKVALNLYEIRRLLSSGKSIYDLPLKVTYYARVSTDKYEQLNSLGNQITYYEDLIKHNTNWTFVPGYVDEGISGTSTEKRDSFLRMIKDAYSHKFNLILTKEISRFSRNTLDSIKYTQELLSNDIGVFFECDSINTFTPDSELRLTIMASMAQEEVRKLSERVKFGFQRSIKSGHVLGNNAIWGYRKDNCKLVIVPEEAEIIKKIFDMYVHDHLGMRTIGQKLSEQGYRSRNDKPFPAASIKGILTNPKYKGYYCGNKTRVVDYRLKTIVSIDENDWVYYKDEENVPPIVSEEIWNEAQRIIATRSDKLGSDKMVFTNRYPFSGKIICKEHNTTYRRKVNISSGKVKKKKILWACGDYIKYGMTSCNGPLLYENELRTLIGEVITEFIKNRTEVVDELMEEYTKNFSSSKIKDNILVKSKATDELLKKKDILLELRVGNKITDEEFDIKNDKYNLEIKQLKEELDKLVIQDREFALSEDNISKLKQIAQNELKFTEENSDEMIYALLDKIYVTKVGNDRNKAHLDIYLNFPVLKEVKENVHYFCIDYTFNQGRRREYF